MVAFGEGITLFMIGVLPKSILAVGIFRLGGEERSSCLCEFEDEFREEELCD